MTTRISFILGGAALLVLMGGVFMVTNASRPCAQGCNVILIMMDTLSAEHLAAYGYDRDTLPRTSAFFADHGVIFDNATANSPWTLPSFTGMYFSDLATNVTYKDLDDPTRPALQDTLRDAGYTIRAVETDAPVFINEALLRRFTSDEFIPAGQRPFTAAAPVLARLYASSTPFFLLVHSYEVHGPYAPDAPYDEYYEQIEGYSRVTFADILKENAQPVKDQERADAFRLRYDQGIAEADGRVADFLENIPPERLTDTVIIFASDHGEAFGEHGMLWHASSLYEDQLAIPLMMRIPGVRPHRVSETVSLMDMAPTILSLAHIPVPERFKGQDLVPLIQGSSLGNRIIPLVNGAPEAVTKIPMAQAVADPPSLEELGVLGTEESLIVPMLYGVRSGSQKALSLGPQLGPVSWFDLSKDHKEKEDLSDSVLENLPESLRDALVHLVERSGRSI